MYTYLSAQINYSVQFYSVEHAIESRAGVKSGDDCCPGTRPSGIRFIKESCSLLCYTMRA